MADQSLENADNPVPGPETANPKLRKRKQSKSVKAQEAEDETKLRQMVQSDALFIFIAKKIEGDPDTWSILLTKSHGKIRIAKRFISQLFQYTDKPTNGKT